MITRQELPTTFGRATLSIDFDLAINQAIKPDQEV